ncbi:MAG TPA: MerR family transcriptional regulator [Spirochaetota bacterium]
MKIGEFSRRSGLTVHTIRYYEKIGIIKKNGKDSSGHREYHDMDIEWVKFLGCLKAVGMSIESIQYFVKLREQGDSTIAERVRLMKLQREKLEHTITEFKSHLDHINYKIAHFEKIFK